MSSNLTLMQKTGVSDLSFKDYNKRQLFEISAERNKERVLKTKPAGNFYYHNNAWTPLKYEGFAVVSMLNENERNEPLQARLIEIQNELHYNLSPVYAFYQLPSGSFHQTIANTLSADRFKEHILNAGLLEDYPEIVAAAFEHIRAEENDHPIRMKMVGLSVFGTAIGMLGVIENEDHYNRIIDFRSGFYGNEALAQLDVRLTRPFIGHITLSYIEHSLNKNQKEHLAEVINEINESLSAGENYFYISRAGLRRYHHLAEFTRQDNYPVYSL